MSGTVALIEGGAMVRSVCSTLGCAHIKTKVTCCNTGNCE